MTRILPFLVQWASEHANLLRPCLSSLQTTTLCILSINTFQLPAPWISPPASLTFSVMPSCHCHCPTFHVAVSQEVSHQNYGRISFPASHLTCDPYQSHSSAPRTILFTYHMCWHKHTSFSPEKFPKITLQDTKALRCNYSESWVRNDKTIFILVQYEK